MQSAAELRPFPYTVAYRNIRYPRLEFRTGTLLVVLPFGQDEGRMLTSHRCWIERKYSEIRTSQAASLQVQPTIRTPDEFKNLVERFVREFVPEIQRIPGRVFFRCMKTKWASCSRNGNLTVNTLLGRLPEDLVGYVIYHELVHLRCRKHNRLFWSCIRKNFDDPEYCERQLCTYWFLLHPGYGAN